jgi:enoyl-CoA hydratase
MSSVSISRAGPVTTVMISRPEALAAEIARFPQDCLRGDRASVYAQWELPLDAALAHEFQLGMRVIDRGGAQRGALEFIQTKGHTDE